MRNFILKVSALILAPSLLLATTDKAVFANKEIEKMINSSGLPLTSLSIQAELYPKGNTLISLHPEKMMNPASVSKLVTAAAALDGFPAGYQFLTQLKSNAPIEDGVLKGDLYLVGGGDPAFVSESMWNLVNQFIRTGVREITGNIIVDDTLYNSTRFTESRRSQRVDRAYDAPVGAMSFNWNSVNIYIQPGTKIGEKAKVWIDPENDYISLVNSATTTKGNSAKLSIDRNRTDTGDRILVKGSIGINAPEQISYKSITKPDLWSGANLKAFLQRRQVKVNGSVKVGSAPSSSRVLATEKSKPVAYLVSDMNKFSNNYVAEMLTKGLAVANNKEPTIEEGLNLFSKYFDSRKIDKSQFIIKNPSGLTNENRMSASGTISLLKSVRQDFRIFPEFITGLPVSGIDGTLKSRFKQGEAAGWVRAKTGYLAGAVSLAGYAGREDGQMVVFAFFHNGKGTAWQVRNFFDQLATKLITTNIEGSAE